MIRRNPEVATQPLFFGKRGRANILVCFRNTRKKGTKSVRGIELERKAWKLDKPPKKSGFLVGFLNFSRFLFALSILYEQY